MVTTTEITVLFSSLNLCETDDDFYATLSKARDTLYKFIVDRKPGDAEVVYAIHQYHTCCMLKGMRAPIFRGDMDEAYIIFRDPEASIDDVWGFFVVVVGNIEQYSDILPSKRVALHVGNLSGSLSPAASNPAFVYECIAEEGLYTTIANLIGDSVVAQVNTLADDIHGQLVNVYRFAQICVNLLVESFRNTISTISIVNRTVQTVRGAGQWIVEKSKTITKILISVVLFALGYKAGMYDNPTQGLIAGASILAGFLDHIEVPTLLGNLNTHFFHAEGRDERDATVYSYVLSFLSIGMMSLIDTAWKACSLRTITGVCTTFIAMSRAWELINMDKVLAYLPQCFTTLYYTISAGDPFKLIARSYANVRRQYFKYTSTSSPEQRTTLLSAYAAFNMTLDAQLKFLTADQIAKSQGFTKDLATILASFLASAGRVSRRTPLWIYVAGKKGVGKTYFSRRLTCEIATIFGWHEGQAYDRDANPFWNGYRTDHKIVRIDDFLANTIDPNIIDMLTLVSSNPAMVNMATIDNPDIGMKGMAFTSYVIITTSNFLSPTHCTQLYNADAWLSRRSMVIEPLLVDESGRPCNSPSTSGLLGDDERLDMSRVEARYGTDYSDYPHMRFRLYKACAVNFCSSVQVCTWGVLYERIVDLCYKWVNKKDFKQSSFTTNKALAQCGAVKALDKGDLNVEILTTNIEALQRSFAARSLQNRQLIESNEIADNIAVQNLTNALEHNSTMEEVSDDDGDGSLSKSRMNYTLFRFPPPQTGPPTIDTPKSIPRIVVQAPPPEPESEIVEVEEEATTSTTTTTTTTEGVIEEVRDDEIELASGRRKQRARPPPEHTCCGKLCGCLLEVEPLEELDTSQRLERFNAIKTYEAREVPQELPPLSEDLSPEVTSASDYFFGIVGALGIVGAAYGAFSMFSKIMDKKPDDRVVYDADAEFQSGSAYSNNTRKTGRVQRSLNGGDKEAVLNTANKNMAELFHNPRDTEHADKRLGTILFLKGTIAVMPYHFMHDYTPNQEYEIKAPGQLERSAVTATSVKRLFVDNDTERPRDLCLVKFSRINNFPDITNRLPSKDNKRQLHRSNLLIAGLTSSKYQSQYYMQEVAATLEHDPEAPVSNVRLSVNDDKYVSLRVCYSEYFVCNVRSLRKGDCGAILMTPNTSHNSVFYGMYTSQHGALNHYFEPLFIEDLGLNSYPIPNSGDLYDDTRGAPLSLTSGMGKLNVRGVVTSSYRVNRSFENPIQRSPLYERTRVGTPCCKFPSILSPNDVRNLTGKDPLSNIDKYNNDNKPLNSDMYALLGQARRILGDKLNSKVPTLTVASVRTEDEALSGVPGEFDSLPRSGSPGFPHVKHRPPLSTGRGHLFTDVEPEGDTPFKRTINSTKAGKVLRTRLDNLNKCLEARTLPNDLFWTDCAKVEKLKQRKIDSVSTRIFSAAPLEYFISCRQYFMDFAKYITDYHRELPFGIGMDVHSREWHDMWKDAARFGSMGYDGDYHGFDGSVHGELVEVCTELINAWYTQKTGTDKGNAERRVLMQFYAYGTHIADSTVYGTNGGTPSGHYLTAVVNSMINLLYIIMAFANKYPQSASQFWDLVWVNTYGDDNLIVTRTEFSGNDLRDFLAVLGIQFTPADKNGNNFVSKPLEKLEFLKHTSRFVNGVYFPMMVAPSINGMLNWYKPLDTTQADEEMIVSTWDDALIGMCFWEDQSYFDDAREAMLKVAVRHNYTSSVRSRREVLSHLQAKWDTVDLKIFEDPDVTFHSGDMHEGAVIADPISGPNVTVSQRRNIVPRPAVSIAADPVEYGTITEKWFTVDTVNWSVTDGSSDTLWRAKVPLSLMVNQQFRQAIDNMQYMNFEEMEVRFLLNGTRFHQGALVVTFFPGTLQKSITWYPGTSKIAMLNLTHGFMYPMTNEPLSMRIPFSHPETAIETTGGGADSMQGTIGVLSVSVFNVLRVATNASTTISFTVQARLVKPKFYLTKPLESTVFAATPRDNNLTRKDIKLHGGASSRHSVVNNYDYIISGGANTIQQETTGDEYDQSASTELEASYDQGMMDKVNAGGSVLSVFRRPFPGLNAIKGCMQSELFAAHPETCPTVSKADFGVDDDEMQVSYLMSRQGFANTFEWSTSDAVGDVLESGLLTPSIYTNNYRLPGNVTSLESMPTPDFTVQLFAMYQLMEIEIRLRIIASPFATGRLLITPMFGYFQDTIDPSAIDSQYQTIISLEEDKREYTLKWAVPTNIPLKYVTATHRLNMTERTRGLVSVGMFFMTVLVPYKVGEGIPTTCEVNFTYSVPQDKIKCYFYNTMEVGLNGSVVPPLIRDIEDEGPRIRLHSGKRGSDDQAAMNTDEAVSGPSQGTGQVKGEYHNLKPILSLRDICKCYNIVGDTDTGIAYGGSRVDIANLLRWASPQALIGGIYTTYKGGWHWITDVSNAKFAFIPGFTIGYNPNLPSTTEALKLGRSHLFNTSNPTGEVTTFSTIFVSPYKFVYTTIANSTTSTAPILTTDLSQSYLSFYDASLCAQGSLLLRSSGSDNGTIWMAMADNGRFGRLVGPVDVFINELFADI